MRQRKTDRGRLTVKEGQTTRQRMTPTCGRTNIRTDQERQTLKRRTDGQIVTDRHTHFHRDKKINKGKDTKSD